MIQVRSARIRWWAYEDTTPLQDRRTWAERCLTETPQYAEEELRDVCLSPDHCDSGCGYDPRCRPWYQEQMAVIVPGPPRAHMSSVYVDYFRNTPVITLSFPVYNASYRAPHSVTAISAVDLHLNEVRA